MTFKMVGLQAIFAILYFYGLSDKKRKTFHLSDLENTKLLFQSQRTDTEVTKAVQLRICTVLFRS